MNKFLYQIKKLIPKKLFKRLQPIYHFVFSWLAAVRYGRPSEKMIVIGVTGTTGKTTSAYLIAHTLIGLGYKVGYTSTAMFHDGVKEWNNNKKMTMPGRFFVQNMLADMVKNGCQFAIVETTSEGVRQFRHRFINYDILVFTGLYPEHIDSHGSFENYKAAKGELFAHLKRCKGKFSDQHKQVSKTITNLSKLGLERVKKTIIVNSDDEHAEYFLGFWAEQKLGFSQQTPDASCLISTLVYDEINATQAGTGFKVRGVKFQLQLIGAFNAANAMTAVTVAVAQGVALPAIRDSLAKISGVPGRLERIDVGQPFSVLVDYAFEPNAMTKLYETVAMLPHNQIIHVLGATGGGRDVARRPILGKIAGTNADFVIATNDDPYDDDPDLLADQIMIGAEQAGKKKNENLFKILDRRQAIVKALTLANSGNIVLLTGKGNEQGIYVKNGIIEPWDDRQVAKEEIAKKLLNIPRPAN
ncbi:MAG: UDP-N-acetylmuramyl-tripeptide synthetase [Candidatus Falkowbacteria bacterium]